MRISYLRGQAITRSATLPEQRALLLQPFTIKCDASSCHVCGQLGCKLRNYNSQDEIVNFNNSVRVHSALFVKVELDKDTSLRKADRMTFGYNLPVRAVKLLGIPCIHDVVRIHKMMKNGKFMFGSGCRRPLQV